LRFSLWIGVRVRAAHSFSVVMAGLVPAIPIYEASHGGLNEIAGPGDD